MKKLKQKAKKVLASNENPLKNFPKLSLGLGTELRRLGPSCKMRRRRIVSVIVVVGFFRVKPATDSRFARSRELQSEPKLRLKLEAEFEFWVEHLNAADLISVTRRLGRRRRRRRPRRCHDERRRAQKLVLPTRGSNSSSNQYELQ